MPEMSQPVLPIVQGDWVAWKGDGPSTQIGRVQQSYWDREPGGVVSMDVVLYRHSGEKVGRVSPAYGGPRTFEPAVEFDERWERIEPHSFPLKLKDIATPTEGKPGWFTLGCTFYHPHAGGLKAKPVRTVVRKQSRDYVRSTGIDILPVPTNQADIDAASMRRAAQELRDMAKKTADVEFASHMRSRATALEADADKISPRVA